MKIFNEQHDMFRQTVRSFVEKAFAEVDRQSDWSGEGVDEIGKCAKTGKILVKVDSRYFRPTEVDLLIGNPAKAKRLLGWEATTTLDELCAEMVREDLKVIAREAETRRPDEERPAALYVIKS